MLEDFLFETPQLKNFPTTQILKLIYVLSNVFQQSNNSRQLNYTKALILASNTARFCPQIMS